MTAQEIQTIFSTGLIKAAPFAKELYPTYSKDTSGSLFRQKLKGGKYRYFTTEETEQVTAIFKRLLTDLQRLGTVELMNHRLINRGGIAAHLYPSLAGKVAAAKIANKANGVRQFSETELNQVEELLKNLQTLIESYLPNMPDGGRNTLAGILAGGKIDPNIFNK